MMTDDGCTRVSKEEAKALIDDLQFGFIITASIDDVPTIGTVPPGELKKEISAETYRFGELQPPEGFI